MSMCLLRPNFAVPLAQLRLPVISCMIIVPSFCLCPRALHKPLSNIISLDVSDKLAYSASVEDNATAIYFLLLQATGTSPSVVRNPETDFLSDSPAHSVSAWPINLSVVGQIRIP
jgi:hypothetical protein